MKNLLIISMNETAFTAKQKNFFRKIKVMNLLLMMNQL